VRFLRAVLIAFLTAIVGCILAFFVGDYLTTLAHVPNMEGQRGMMVVFVCAPIGILAGLIVGVVVSLLVARRGAAGFFSALGLSIFTVAVISGLTGAIPYLLSDKPPRIDGQRLDLEFQLRVPATMKIPDQPDGYSIRVSLYTNDQEDRYAFIDWQSIVKTTDHITIPGHVDLLTHSQNRSLLASIGNEPAASQFFAVNLPSAPRQEDEAWSNWIFATRRADLSTVPQSERFALRYRVQPIER